jgi:DivIVA domain-containing protein
MSEHFLNDFAWSAEPLSPEQIDAKEFTSSLKGYDTKEVHDYLSKVSTAYGKALQDVHRLELILEDAKQEALSVDERARHADYELKEAKRLREEAAAELESAHQMRDQAMRQKKEAEEATAKAQALQASASETPADPYSIATQQITEILRAAESVATGTRKEADEIVEVSKMNADKIIADAKESGEEITAAAKELADAEHARAQEAQAKREHLISSMRNVEQQMQALMASALTEFQAPEPSEEEPSGER